MHAFCTRCHRPQLGGWAGFFKAFELAPDDERDGWAFLVRYCGGSYRAPCVAKQTELFGG